ncbi:MAG: peptidoglycan-associated lipoprotein Pal [Nitrospirae bacterium]|nr:peptidoglycan-associated lipoprotein Pal [Nitrospirota bacterium]
MKISRLGIGFVGVVLMAGLAISGCSKKVATIEGTTPSSPSGDVQTTVEVGTAKNGGTEEVVTEPLALLNTSNIAEDTIEPSDTTGKGISDLSEGAGSGEESVPAKDEEKAALTGGLKTGDLKTGDLKDVFFDFDMAILKEGEMDILKKNAEWIKKNGSAVVRIEGHADERGTGEYNLALGEKRAQMIKKYLTVFGAPQNRIATISYGEEKGFCKEHNEECWAQNRRGHFAVVAR